MSNIAYAIHLHFRSDNTLLLQFLRNAVVVEESIVSEDMSETGGIACFFQRHGRADLLLSVFVSSDALAFSETTIPSAFKDSDILQYIIADQAQFFPTLDQEIYVDFYRENSREDNHAIKIVACNIRGYAKLVLLLRLFGIKWVSLGVLGESYNLLPWRQREKSNFRKKQWRLFLIINVSVGFCLLMINFFCISIENHDKEKEDVLIKKITSIQPSLMNLERLNKKYQWLISCLEYQIHVAHAQSRLGGLLLIIEGKRPPGVVLNKILWNDGALSLDGVAQDAQRVKFYLNHLSQKNIHGRIAFMGRSENQRLPVRFEIRSEGVK